MNQRRKNIALQFVLSVSFWANIILLLARGALSVVARARAEKAQLLLIASVRDYTQLRRMPSIELVWDT